MRKDKNLGSTFLGLMLFLVTGMATAGDQVLDQKLRAFLEQTVEHHQVVGLSVGVVQDGEVVYLDAFGTTSLEDGKPMKPENLFHFASVSKPFVATAAMQLVEAGKMDLNAPVTRYLPYFKLDDPRYKEITVKQMLNHTAGMPDVQDYEWDKPQTDPGASERFVRAMASEKLLFDPGTSIRYSNMAFDLMADLIAKVSGMSFEDYVKKNILDPLGMKESNFLYPQTNKALRTSGHTWMLQPKATPHYPYNRRHAGSSTLNSSAAEMTRWIKANLNKGALNGKRILSEAGHDQLTTATFKRSETRYVGLSWFLDDQDGQKTVSHSGADEGFVSVLHMIPERKTGVALVCNYDNAPMGGILRGIYAILDGREPQPVKKDIFKPYAVALMNEGPEAARAKYHELKKNHPDQYRFSSGQLNQVGYHLMTTGNLDASLAVFQFNAELYPDKPNIWDSLAECHLKRGDKEKAVELYRKALKKDPNFASSKKALKKLEAE